MSHSSKVFNDAVHGSIEIHPLCVKIIDTPQFQRLSVCHLAGTLVRALKSRQPELQVTDKEVLCVELAGLCHDLGHGPFSHLWERFLRRINPRSQWKHERTSVEMLDYLVKSNSLEGDFSMYDLHEKDLTFIKELIAKPLEGEEAGMSTTWPYKGRPREKGFLYQIVANDENGVDVDKWDYILRDVHSLGLQVTFSYSRLVKFSRVINMSKTETPDLRICFRDKEATNLFDMFHTRMTLHQKAYQHRVLKTINTMLLDALVLASEHITYRGKTGQNLPLSEVVHDLEAMTYLNDDVFHQIHRSSSTDEAMKKAKTIIHNILTRQYYPYVGHTIPTTCDIPPSDLLQTMVECLPPSSNLAQEDLDVHLVVLSYGNGKENPLERIGFFTKEEPAVYREYRPKEASKMLPSEWEEKIVRVVCRKYDRKSLEEAKVAFSNACDHFGVPKPCWKPWPNVLTPRKRRED